MLLSVLAVGLTGCVSFHSVPLDPSTRAAALTDRRLDSRNWTLEALIAEALANSPELAVAKARHETALAAVVTAGERPNPTVAVAPQIVTPDLNWVNGTYGVVFDWTFETAGKRSRRVEAAREQARATASQVIDTHWKVRATLRRAYLDLWVAQRRETLLNATATKQSEVVTALDQRRKAGEASPLDLAQPRLLAAQLRLQASDATKTVALARASLAAALSMGVSGVSGAEFSFAEFEKEPGKSSCHREQALLRRSDVLVALADYATAEAILKLEIARQYPDFHLNPGYEFDAGNNKWAIGFGLTLPVLNQNQGAIGEAEAKRKELAAAFDAVQTRVLNECDRAAAGVEAARKKLSTLQALLKEQTSQMESMKQLAEAGEEDRLALISSEVEQASISVANLDALAELQAALGEMEAATQTPRSP
ncbi:MAG: TolC family protein [Verrucomicrobiales bacterium]